MISGIGRSKSTTAMFIGMYNKAFYPRDTLYVYFKTRDDISSFKIDYRINAANVPHEIEGKLNVVIEESTDQ
ncbi:MAG: hypothetical protein ABJI69_08660 [Balneola sp.]